MAWKCPTCGDEFDSFRGYANHYNLSSDHSGNALADAVGCETLADLYATMSENAVAEELGVTRPAVKGALKSCGISRRGQSEAEQLKYEQMTEEERRELTESARDEVREKYGDGGFLGQWVSENPDDHAEVAREAEVQTQHEHTDTFHATDSKDGESHRLLRRARYRRLRTGRTRHRSWRGRTHSRAE